MKSYALVAVVVGMLALAATAAASTKHYKTTLSSFAVSTSPPANEFLEYGQVSSTKKACRSNRKMTVVAAYPNGSHKVLDSGRSSKNGAYALVADFTGAESTRIKAAVKKFGSKGHRSVCNAGSISGD